MLLAFVPCGSEKEAEKIARSLIKKKMALCANILPKMTSFFIWNKKLRKSRESLLLLKLFEKNRAATEQEIRKLHSYDVPLIAFYTSDRVNDDFLAWAKKS